MKRTALFIICLAALVSCTPKQEEQKVNARAVPERMDDFVFENNLIAGRFYGEALEGNPTSPGIDIWVKMPGALVADKWYAEAQKDANYYHHNHDGKDCYKVAVSLGGGASAPVCPVTGEIFFPKTNYRSCEILEQTPEKIVFSLSYPEWQAGEQTVSLVKKVTVCADSYFCQVEDKYSFTGDSLNVAAGIFRHPSQQTIVEESVGDKFFAIWEKASDQSVEPEDGMLGVAVASPQASWTRISADLSHGLVGTTLAQGETFSYCFGSCWSKADVKSAADWFAKVQNL